QSRLDGRVPRLDRELNLFSHRLLTSLVQLGAALACHPHLAAVSQDGDADPGRGTGLWIDELNVAQVDRRFLLHEATAGVVLGGFAGLLDDVDVLDEHSALLTEHRDDLALFALVLPGDDSHRVALADAALRRAHHNTSGASDTMRMKRFSRSSRATGPNTRVPRGSFWALRITAALLSNRIEEPSLRL